MQIVKNSCLLIIFFITVSACNRDYVYVTIENPDYKKRYIEILDHRDLQYDIDESGDIRIRISSVEELDSQMKEYYAYVEDDIKKQNQALNE